MGLREVYKITKGIDKVNGHRLSPRVAESKTGKHKINEERFK